jgi:hypothetical protein
MHSSIWALGAYFDTAGRKIDHAPADREKTITPALTVRLLTEQARSHIPRRLARTYGPHPLAMRKDCPPLSGDSTFIFASCMSNGSGGAWPDFRTRPDYNLPDESGLEFYG